MILLIFVLHGAVFLGAYLERLRRTIQYWRAGPELESHNHFHLQGLGHKHKHGVYFRTTTNELSLGLKKINKQAGAELGQAQLKLGLDLTSTSLY